MAYTTILYDADDSGILTITLNRPEKLNAYTRDMMTEMIDAFDRADADDNVRAIIVTGAGRGFCVGAELSSGGDTFNADAREDRESGLPRDGGGRLTLRRWHGTGVGGADSPYDVEDAGRGPSDGSPQDRLARHLRPSPARAVSGARVANPI